MQGVSWLPLSLSSSCCEKGPLLKQNLLVLTSWLIQGVLGIFLSLSPSAKLTTVGFLQEYWGFNLGHSACKANILTHGPTPQHQKSHFTSVYWEIDVCEKGKKIPLGLEKCYYFIKCANHYSLSHLSSEKTCSFNASITF